MNTNSNRLTLLKRSALMSVAALLLAGATVTMSSCSLVLSIADTVISKEIHEQQEQESINKELEGVIPEGVNAAAVTDPEVLESLPATVTKAYTVSNGWCVVEITTKGYADGLVILVAVDQNGAVQGTKVVEHKETDGYGGKLLGEREYGETFLGINLATVDAVDTKTGATVTANAFRNAVKDALNAAVKILEGGSN